jgi:hypothetical protein
MVKRNKGIKANVSARKKLERGSEARRSMRWATNLGISSKWLTGTESTVEMLA